MNHTRSQLSVKIVLYFELCKQIVRYSLQYGLVSHKKAAAQTRPPLLFFTKLLFFAPPSQAAPAQAALTPPPRPSSCPAPPLSDPGRCRNRPCASSAESRRASRNQSAAGCRPRPRFPSRGPRRTHHSPCPWWLGQDSSLPYTTCPISTVQAPRISIYRTSVFLFWNVIQRSAVRYKRLLFHAGIKIVD